MTEKIIATVLVIVLVVVGGWYAFESWWDRRNFGPDKRATNLRNAKRAAEMLRDNPSIQVLDVRSEREAQAGRIPGAVLLPLGSEDFEKEVLARFDTEKPVLVYCAGGFRSRKAVPQLRSMGFEDIHNLHRGMIAWRKAGLPVDT